MRSGGTTSTPPRPRHDARTALLWASHFHDQHFQTQSTWEDLFLKVAWWSFRAVLLERNLSPAVVERTISELGGAFFDKVLGARDRIPGWVEIATRVLERGGDRPVDALAGLLDVEAKGRLARCASGSFGHWPRTTRVLWSDLSPEIRGRNMERCLIHDIREAERLLDFHATLRLVDGWTAGATHPTRSWNVILQNRGRARARLRTLVATGPRERLRDAILSLDGIHARTTEAVRAYALSWASIELVGGFSFGDPTPVDPSCEEPGRASPFDDDETAALSTWLLLVILRGRLAWLVRWIAHGTTDDNDATWGRLLAQALPRRLADRSDSPPRRASYQRLRGHLADMSSDLRGRQEAILRALVDLEPGRSLAGAVRGLLRPGWHPEIPFPRSGYPSMQHHARAALDALYRGEEDSCGP